MPFIVNKLVENIKMMKKDVRVYNPPLQRIYNFENYYETKLRLEGKESEGLRELKEFHDKHPPRPPREIKKPWRYPYEIDRVFLNTTITKSGKVKITLSQPLQDLYDTYQSKAVQPPIEERVRFLKHAHYPEHTLMNLIKKDQRNKKNAVKDQEFIFSIFGTGKLTKKPPQPE